jgi:predicted DNA-binding transcriptional regulator YafY
MGKQLDFERYFWFHEQLKKNRYPSTKDLMEVFEIEYRTAQRNIAFMRDRLKAPLKYSREKGGYYYSEKSYEFPKARFTEKEIMGLIIAECLAHTIPDKRILEEINSFTEKFSFTTGINVNKLKKKISIKNVRYDKVEPKVFEAVIEALNSDRKLWIEYKSRNTQEITERTVNPLHMLLYKGNWHLFAFCEKKDALRNFALSGILQIKISEDIISDDLPNVDIEKLIEENYGIYIHETEADKVEVSLKFHKDVAEIVRTQVWFPLQNLEEIEDGSIILTFPVTDFRELEHDILKYGAYLEVLKPVELREKIKETIAKMSQLY